MAAGFQCDVGSGAAGRVAGHGQGDGFGVGTTAWLGGAAAHDAVVVDNDAADRRVGPGRAEAPAREGQGGAHVRKVVCGGACHTA